jgi:hypothetical protein
MIFFSFQNFFYKKFYSYIYEYYKKIINLVLNDDNNHLVIYNKPLNKYLLNHINDNHIKIISNIEKKYCYSCFNHIKDNTYCVFDKIFCTEYCRNKYINSLKIN